MGSKSVFNLIKTVFNPSCFTSPTSLPSGISPLDLSVLVYVVSACAFAVAVSPPGLKQCSGPGGEGAMSQEFCNVHQHDHSLALVWSLLVGQCPTQRAARILNSLDPPRPTFVYYFNHTPAYSLNVDHPNRLVTTGPLCPSLHL